MHGARRRVEVERAYPRAAQEEERLFTLIIVWEQKQIQSNGPGLGSTGVQSDECSDLFGDRDRGVVGHGDGELGVERGHIQYPTGN